MSKNQEKANGKGKNINGYKHIKMLYLISNKINANQDNKLIIFLI